MESIEAEADKVLKKQKLFHKTSNEQCTNLLKRLQQTKTVLQHSKDAAMSDEAVRQITAKITDSNSEIQSSVKEYYNAINKAAKSIDKKFNWNLDMAGRVEAFDGKEQSLDMALALHFIREGMFDICDMFCKEANISLPSGLKDKFMEMFKIVESLKQHHLEPALKWCQDNASLLAKRSSVLEFQLHKLQFIILLTDENIPTAKRTISALNYARTSFKRFGERHLKEIQRLMASLAYVSAFPWHTLVKKPTKKSQSDSSSVNSDLSDSPYCDIVSNDLWSNIEALFMNEFCIMLGLSQNSPLKVAADVGIPAIPTMIKLRSVMDERRKERPKIEMWTIGDELPVEIPLSKNHRFHSIFACPVSREQTSRSNPPMMLSCGHVIGKESLVRLAKGGKAHNLAATASAALSNLTGIGGVGVGGGTSSSDNNNGSSAGGGAARTSNGRNDEDPLAGIIPNSKIKCPYCPTETIASQAIIVYF